MQLGNQTRAGDGARTRDIKLGRLALYQLSYSRDALFTVVCASSVFSVRPSQHGGGRIRTFEGVSRQIYSLLPLAAWVPHRAQCDLAPMAHIATRAMSELTVGIEPTTCRLQGGCSAI